ncbi:MAG: MFS transporter [Acidimicrobiales bacterium]|nr:MFS transporter [Acidimicrobiales bacterium]
MVTTPTTRPTWRDPERVFLASHGFMAIPEWAFFVTATVWWTLDLGLNPLRLVLLGTVLESVLLLSEVPTGVVADRYSRKWSIVIGSALEGSAMILLVSTTNFGVMLLAQALYGVAWTFGSGADVAWLNDELAAQHGAPPADRRVSRILVRRHYWTMMAGFVGIVPGVVLGQWSLRGTMALCGVTLILGSAALAFVMTDHHRFGDDEDELHALSIFREGFRVARRVRPVRLLLVVMLLAGLGAEALDRLGYKRFLDNGDYGDGSLLATGLLFGILAFLAVVVNKIVERTLNRGANLAALSAVLLTVSMVGALLVGLAPALGIAVGLAIQDPCRESLDPVTMAWGNTFAPSGSRATVLSFVSLSHGVGEVVGGVALASLAELAGLRWAMIGAAAIWLAGAAVANAARGETAEPVTTGGG